MALGNWLVPGIALFYKWMPANSNYPPASPWNSPGRFGDTTHKTLYLAESSEGAIAEYLRRHPEFLDLQDFLVIQIFEIEISVNQICLDVRTESDAISCGISMARLTSSEANEVVRYAECRILAKTVINDGGVGIYYPSAAAMWRPWNLVLFGDPDVRQWIPLSESVVPTPVLLSTQIRALEA